MTKTMIALALLLLGVVTLGMSHQAVAEDPVAVYEQGLDLLLGRNGVEQDSLAAIDKFESLAEAGWAIAQHRLGDIYREGNGVPKSLILAYAWYHRAADQGYPPAREALARISEHMSLGEIEQARYVSGNSGLVSALGS